MHVQRVVTNETCNQNCCFCNARRPTETAAFVSRVAVRRRIAQALDGDTREIVLTGGEPTLRSDLPDLVRRAAAGSARVVLETNASALDVEKANALAAAGLAVARVQLVAWGADAADPITREPGGFTAALAAIRTLAGAGVSVEVTTPIVRRNLHLVAAMPSAIVTDALPVSALVLVVPLEAPDPSECATLGEASAAITRVADEARRVGLPLRLDPTTYLPPCIFERPDRVTQLFALNRGNGSRPGYQRVDACAECLVIDRCPGIPTAGLHGEPPPPLRPIVEQRLRRRLTVVSSVDEQVARELVTHDEARGGDTRAAEVTVRVNFHCNQACEFCFVSTHLPPASEAAVRTAIETAARAHAVVILSGGEPTLNPRLVEYVRLASELGAASVELQSNATRLQPELAAALAEAGLKGAMISLHGSTAEVSDAVTGAPGTFAATLRGIDALAQTPVRVRLNFVFCQENRHNFPSFVALVAERWPHAGIVVSFVGSHTDVVPRSTALIPTFHDIMPSLLAGLARARAAGIEVSGFDSMCGLPLCVVPAAERGLFSHVAVPAGAGDGEFVKAESCARCTETHRCFGVRRGYADLYGTAELEPIADHRSPATA